MEEGGICSQRGGLEVEREKEVTGGQTWTWGGEEKKGSGVCCGGVFFLNRLRYGNVYGAVVPRVGRVMSPPAQCGSLKESPRIAGGVRAHEEVDHDCAHCVSAHQHVAAHRIRDALCQCLPHGREFKYLR